MENKNNQPHRSGTAQSPEDEAFERYDFGDGVTVEAADGWNRDSASNEVTRNVYAKYDDDTPESPTHKLNFTAVLGAGSDTDSGTLKVAQAWASDIKGQQIGHLPSLKTLPAARRH